MELFKLRYNLYKYFIKNDFKFKDTFETLNIFKNLSYIIIIFFILIFIIGFEYINAFIIFFIIIHIMFIYYVELILIKLENIKTNKYFQNYYNYYNTLNKFFIINFDNINDINNIMYSSNAGGNNYIITNIELTYAGIGYQPNQTFTITYTGASNAIASVNSLRDGSLSSEIYILNNGSFADDNYRTPTITLNSTSVTSINNATFKAYYSLPIGMLDIKEYSISYLNVYENIKRKAIYIDNILKEDIDEHINLIKKENDLLKYIDDIYDKKYLFLKKFLIINKEKNKKIFDIIEQKNDNIIIKINKDTYLINLEFFEKYKDNHKNMYLKFVKEFDLKDLSFLENANLYHHEKILESINNFDKNFNYLLIIVIIILTIIFHIFYIELY